jgi:hypothetical protein
MDAVYDIVVLIYSYSVLLLWRSTCSPASENVTP